MNAIGYAATGSAIIVARRLEITNRITEATADMPTKIIKKS